MVPATPVSLPPAVAGNVLWQDGKTVAPPRGKLLSDNVGYYGETVTTGVSYRYSTQPNKQLDIYKADGTTFGRRLLDGEIKGNSVYVPVIMENGPLVVEFDFKQLCTFSEVDVADTRDKSVTLGVETRADENADWTKWPEVTQAGGGIQRLVFEWPVQARYLRLTANSGAATTALDEVWVWGDAKSIAPARGVLPEMKDATPGDATILDAGQLEAWRRSTGFKGQSVTWQVPDSPWHMLEREPLKRAFLPGKEGLEKPVTLTSARNEGEAAALYMVNPSDKPRDVTVELSGFRKAGGGAESSIQGKLAVAGAIWTKRWGQTLRPLFFADNKLGGDLMEKYLTNGATIKDFPTLHLPPGGTAMLWLTVHTQNTPPGRYEADIKCGESSIPVQLEVRPVTLPYPNVWLYQWNEAGTMLPFRNPDALRNEVAYMQQDLGITVWSQLPTPGTDAALAREMEPGYSHGGRETYYRFRPLIDITNQGYMGKLDPATFDAVFRARVKQGMDAAEAQARALNLSHDDYAYELWDEPWAKSLVSFAALSKLIKEMYPDVRLLANPLFWGSKGSSPDAEHVRFLKGWYNETIDISIPVLPNLNAELFPQANAEYYDHPRFVRAMYVHPCPGRLVSWEAFKRGYNGWGFYAYYRLRGDAWNDFDTTEFDYQIVYPGPHGAIPTIESELMRESWDDYRLLTLLKQQGKGTLLQELIHRFETEVPLPPDTQDEYDRLERGVTANRVLPQLRAIALDAAGK